MKNIKSKNGTGKALSILHCPFSFVFVLLLAIGCTKNFEEMNTNPTGVSDGEGNADFVLLASFLAQGQRIIIPPPEYGHQVTTHLASDGYAGYFGQRPNFGGNSYLLTYNMLPSWIDRLWQQKYPEGLNPLYKVERQTREDAAMQDIFAFAKLLKVSAMHRLSDKSGPIMYSRYNRPNAESGVDYDSQQDLFVQYFKDLDTAANIFKNIRDDAPSPAMALSDQAYTGTNGRYARYLKIANTLRLRLALRIAYIDPTEAKTQGEKALDPANGGLLEDATDDWSVALAGEHPINIFTGYKETRLHASLESFLTGYGDPRLPKWFVPAEDPHPDVSGRYKGVRTGIVKDNATRYEGYSQPQPFANRMQVMGASEAWFLKAEAALRGWANAGDAKTNYETGVRRSFETNGLAMAQANAYLADAVSKPAEYRDPLSVNPNENDVLNGSPYLSTITIKWEEGDTNDKKLERIITQKWISLFPDGDEAWSEYRRTGYPMLFPVIKNDSNGLIPSVPGIRRLPFSQKEYDTNRAAVEAAVTLLGGPDNGGTRLWWDVPNKGF